VRLEGALQIDKTCAHVLPSGNKDYAAVKQALESLVPPGEDAGRR
jgi:hypothetical protein